MTTQKLRSFSVVKFKLPCGLAELLIFLHEHNESDFRFSELDRLRIFSNSESLSKTLKFCCNHDLVKTNIYTNLNSKPIRKYEIKGSANTLAEWFKRLKKE
jgi:hypothetical protein